MAVTVRKTGPRERELSFSTKLAPQAVYDYLADFQNHREWVPDIVGMEKTGDGPAGVGTGYKTIEAMKPGSKMKADTACEITALEPPRRIAWRARTAANSGPLAMRSRWAFIIEPDGVGSRVTQQYAMEPPNALAGGFLRVFSVIADRLMGGLGASPKNVTKHMENLQRILDRRAAQG